MERSFKGIWIPSEIWLDDRLTALDKIILAEIDSLDNEDGCTASNDYLADFCGCNVSKVSRAISKLKECGLIKSVEFDGRHRKLQSCLAKKARQTVKKSKADYEKEQASTLYKNNIDYYNSGDKKKRFAPPTLEEVKAYCIERGNSVDAQRFIDYYTSNGWKVGKNPMKDWKAAVRNWERADKAESKAKDSSYDISEWEKYAENFDPNKDTR